MLAESDTRKIDIGAICRDLRRAAKVSQGYRADVGLRLGDIAQRHHCSVEFVTQVKHGRRHQRIFVYRAGHRFRRYSKPQQLEEPGRNPYCPCGRAFEFDVDLVMGRVTDFCPAGCSSLLLSADRRPRRRRRA